MVGPAAPKASKVISIVPSSGPPTGSSTSTAFGLMAPAFAVTMHRAGLPLRPVGTALRLPATAAATMALVVVAVDQVLPGDFQALLVGGVVGSIVYGSLVLRWWRGRSAFTDLLSLVRGVSPGG